MFYVQFTHITRKSLHRNIFTKYDTYNIFWVNCASVLNTDKCYLQYHIKFKQNNTFIIIAVLTTGASTNTSWVWAKSKLFNFDSYWRNHLKNCILICWVGFLVLKSINLNTETAIFIFFLCLSSPPVYHSSTKFF